LSWCNQTNTQGNTAGTDGATPALSHQAPGFDSTEDRFLFIGGTY